MSGNCFDEPRMASNWKLDPHFISPDRGTSPRDLDAVSQYSGVSVTAQSNCGVKQRMALLFEKQLHTDVVFFPNDDSTSISAHKAVLAVGSPLFEKMLFGDGVSTASKMEVKIKNLSFQAFKYIVRYLYTDEILFENDSLAQEILDGAREFEIQPLIDQCVSYFKKQTITDENVCSKLQQCISDKIQDLKDRCTYYIQKNTYNVINSSGFLNSNAATVRTICKLKKLNLRREVDLLEAVITWLNLQPPGTKRQTTESLLKNIRFLTFTSYEIGETIQKYPDLLSAEDGLQILMFVNNPPSKANLGRLPSWCNISKDNRCEFEAKPTLPVQRRPRTTPLFGKLIIPLKSSYGCQSVNKIISKLQLTCRNGCHEIYAMKLAFQHPVSHKSMVRLSIHIHVSPSGFNFHEDVEVANSMEVRIPFKSVIFARMNDVVHFEVETLQLAHYNFLQFDDSRPIQPNGHFDYIVGSIPSEGKLFLIKEVEYRARQRGNR